MALFRTIAPEAEPVSLAEVKAHLRLDHDGEDALIGELVKAAVSEVEATTGLALIEQNWRLTLDDWPASGTLLIRRAPIREVLSITVYGADGGAAVLDPAAYLVDAVSRPARIRFFDTPAAGRAMNGIEVDFSAGFGESGADVPDILKRAVVVLAAHWFEFRAVYGADSQPVSHPEGFRRLIAAHLPVSIA